MVGRSVGRLVLPGGGRRESSGSEAFFLVAARRQKFSPPAARPSEPVLPSDHNNLPSPTMAPPKTLKSKPKPQQRQKKPSRNARAGAAGSVNRMDTWDDTIEEGGADEC